LTSTLSTERTWRSARTALTGAEVQALRESVTAFKALGGGWSPGPVPEQQAAR
jgi:outer membrane protein TolC